MSLAYFNLENMKNKPRFWICKPNKSRIGKLVNIYDIKLSTKENNLSELSFTIPIEIELNHELADNPLLEKLQGYYLVEMLKGEQTEYFVITNDSGILNNDGVTKSYTLYSYEHKLSKKFIRNQEWTSEILSKITLDLLSETSWTLGSVPAEFDLKYRSYEVSTSSVLQCIYDIAEKFGAMVEFDTVNKRVNYYSTTRGMDRGLRFKEGLYLESFDINYDYDGIVTRLKVYGEDELEFRSLSPTGSNYIEDYSWFMYPFEAKVKVDENNNPMLDVNGDEIYEVVEHSKYMSDELCLALMKYNKLMTVKDGEFNSLVTQRTDAEDLIIQKTEELRVLLNDLKILNNELDVINHTYGENATGRTDYQQCIASINSKNIEIDNKELEIEGIKSNLEIINQDILQLQSDLQISNNFTNEEILELDDYIIEGEYVNDSISNEQDLLDEALEIFEEMKVPTITLSIDIVSFLDGLENDVNRKKLILGDTVRFKSTKLKTEIKARLSEINYDYSNDTVSVVLSNEREARDLETKITDMIYGSASTSASFNMEKFKYNKAVTQSDDVSKILNSTFDATLNGIKGGLNSSITWNERGIFAQSITEPNKMVVIQGGQIALSNDSLQSIQVAITPDGVISDRLVGRIVLSNKMHVEDELGIVTIESGTITLKDDNDNVTAQLGRYKNPSNPNENKYGLLIPNGQIDIRTSENDNRGVRFNAEGMSAYNSNGVQTFNVESTTGKVTIAGSLDFRTSTNPLRGIVLDSNGLSGYNSSGTRTFYVNTNGALTASSANITGTINATGGSISGNLTVTGTLTGGTISGSTINGGTINGANITTTHNITVGNELYVGTGDTQNRKISLGKYASNSGIIKFETELDKLSLTSESTIELSTYKTAGKSIILNTNEINFKASQINFNNATVSGLTVSNASYATSAGTANYATSAGSASSADSLSFSGSRLFARNSTSYIMGLSWNGSDRIYFQADGMGIGYITLS